ncbi:MAG: CPBP family intramembrane metalloprotease [Alphaproteobacteria bacterium]|nr:CPBP family intramembrane metalloprotease [Alphaproteobacteria bacterium]
MTSIETEREDESPPAPALLRRLRIEFCIIFLAVPLAHAAFIDTLGTLTPIIAIFGIAAVLLTVTTGFHWREVVDFRGLSRHIPLIAIATGLCVIVTFGLTLALVPERFLNFPRYNPERFALVVALYPFLSVFGQEIAYRLLLFRRYRPLFLTDVTAIAASAFAFALAHAFFGNWIAVSLSFAGGLVFAWAYLRTRSFPLVWILHSLAGQVLFASGLGIYFYHGAIPG